MSGLISIKNLPWLLIAMLCFTVLVQHSKLKTAQSEIETLTAENESLKTGAELITATANNLGKLYREALSRQQEVCEVFEGAETVALSPGVIDEKTSKAAVDLFNSRVVNDFGLRPDESRATDSFLSQNGKATFDAAQNK